MSRFWHCFFWWLSLQSKEIVKTDCQLLAPGRGLARGCKIDTSRNKRSIDGTPLTRTERLRTLHSHWFWFPGKHCQVCKGWTLAYGLYPIDPAPSTASRHWPSISMTISNRARCLPPPTQQLTVRQLERLVTCCAPCLLQEPGVALPDLDFASASRVHACV